MESDDIICRVVVHVQFSNLYGAVYRQGNVAFTDDGNCVISPVGNRLSHFDLKKYMRNNYWLCPHCHMTLT